MLNHPSEGFASILQYQWRKFGVLGGDFYNDSKCNFEISCSDRNNTTCVLCFVSEFRDREP